VHLASTRAVVGTTIQGTIVLTNNTHQRTRINDLCGVFGQVGLVRRGISFDPLSSDVACFSRFAVAPGHRYSMPIAVQTLYDGCGGTGQPQCGSGNHPIPELPLGTYAVKVVSVPLPKGTVVIAPPKVTVTSADTGRTSGPQGGSLLVQSYACEVDHFQPPLWVYVTHDGRAVDKRTRLGVNQVLVLPLRPGVYYIHSNAHAPEGARVVNGFQSGNEVLQNCA
jgi:hypothetical protein